MHGSGERPRRQLRGLPIEQCSQRRLVEDRGGRLGVVKQNLTFGVEASGIERHRALRRADWLTIPSRTPLAPPVQFRQPARFPPPTPSAARPPLRSATRQKRGRTWSPTLSASSRSSSRAAESHSFRLRHRDEMICPYGRRDRRCDRRSPTPALRRASRPRPYRRWHFDRLRHPGLPGTRGDLDQGPECRDDVDLRRLVL